MEADNDAFAIIQCVLEEPGSSADILTIVSAMRLKEQVSYRGARVVEAIQLFQSAVKISEAYGLTKGYLIETHPLGKG